VGKKKLNMSEVQIIQEVIKKCQEKRYKEISFNELSIVVKNLANSLEMMDLLYLKAKELTEKQPMEFYFIILGLFEAITLTNLKWWLHEISKILEAQK
jgi:hypothetical protein